MPEIILQPSDMDATARAIAEVFGPVFASTDPQEWNELTRQGRVIYDEEGRAVGVKDAN